MSSLVDDVRHHLPADDASQLEPLANSFVRERLACGTTTSQLPWDLLNGVSVAAGDIEPGVMSKIYIHQRRLH
jgi:hypothetical protein